MRIISEGGIASGVRRIEAVTGEHALAAVESQADLLSTVAGALKSSAESLPEKLEQLLARNKMLEKELAAANSKLAAASADEWLGEAQEIEGLKVLVKSLEGVDAKSLLSTLDQLKNKLGSCAIILASVNEGKIALAAGVSADSTKRLRAGDLLKYVAAQVGGKGGGRPDMESIL